MTAFDAEVGNSLNEKRTGAGWTYTVLHFSRVRNADVYV